jgi:hypothetical protein
MEDDDDRTMAEKLQEILMTEEEKKDTIPSSPPTPPERETQPEMTPEMQEVIGVIIGVATEVAKSTFANLGKGWVSLCLIGPSLARIAAAHETLQQDFAREAKIFNVAYDHSVNQTHHSMKG